MATLIREFDLFATDSYPAQLLPTATICGSYRSRAYKNLVVLDKVNGGKADALNACINASRHPLVCCVDSDSILDAGGLARVAMPFFEDPESTIATGGTISIFCPNGRSASEVAFDASLASGISWRWLDMVQAMEYLRAFLVGRMGWDFLGCTTIISGAFGLFRKSLVIKVGGYAKGCIGEDMELLLRLHRYSLEDGQKYRVCFLPDPVCWTEAPSDLKILSRQRSRWQQGLCDSLWRNRSMLFKPKFGLISCVALPYLLFFEVLAAPLEVISYIVIAVGLAMGYTDLTRTALFLAVTMTYGMILNLGAIVIDQATFARYRAPKDLLSLILGSLIEQLGFRQLHLVWRQQGIYRWLRGKHVWGEMTRKGFTPPPAAGGPSVGL